MTKKILITVGLFLIAILFLEAANHGRSTKRHGPKQETAAARHDDPAPKTEPPAASKVINASFRPLNFALLKGGITSVDQFFTRVQDDPVLHAFYGDCVDPHATMAPLAEDILVFSTFRKGDEIKWARKPLLVRQGEYVLTFCGKTVLARCGNLISWSPMGPSEDVPPGLLEVPEDAISDPAAPVTVTAETHALPVVVASAAAPGPEPASSRRKFFFVPPVYIPGGSGSSGSSGHVVGVAGPPPAQLAGDEFSGHQALFTLLIGLFVVGLLKLVTR